jgi:hypothetical protein
LVVVFVVARCTIIWGGVKTKPPRAARLCARAFGTIAANIGTLINQPNRVWEEKQRMLHLERMDWQGNSREPGFESGRRGPIKSIDEYEIKARLLDRRWRHR